MKRRVQNPQSYAIDSPVTLAPGETAEVEDSSDVQRQLDAGVLREVGEQIGEAGPEVVSALDGAEVKPAAKTRSTRKDQDK